MIRERAAALAVWCALRLPDGRKLIEAAEPWQLDDATAILEPPADGGDLHYWTRPRGASKTSDLAGIVIAMLATGLIGPGEVGYSFAADRDQAALLLDALRGWVARTPGLAELVGVDRWVVTSTVHGGRFEVMAADAASAYGLSPKLLILDEVAQWPSTPSVQELWTAIVSAQPKRPATMVLATTSGDPSHFSYRILEAARASDRWRTSEIPGPSPFIDQAALVEQKAMLTPSKYAQLHLNQWTTGEDRLASWEALRACVQHDGPLSPRPGIRYALSLDVGLTSDRTVLAAMHRAPLEDYRPRQSLTVSVQLRAMNAKKRGLDPYRLVPVPDAPPPVFVLDRVWTWQGSRKSPVDLAHVQGTILAAHREFNGAKLTCDPWQAAQLAQNLRRAGLTVDEFNFSAQSVGRLALPLFQAIREGRLHLIDDEELLDELAHVQLVEKAPGSYRLDHASGRHDDRAIALALGISQLLSHAVLDPFQPARHVVDNRLKGRR